MALKSLQCSRKPSTKNYVVQNVSNVAGETLYLIENRVFGKALISVSPPAFHGVVGEIRLILLNL
jgi:hypothetical protein